MDRLPPEVLALIVHQLSEDSSALKSARLANRVVSSAATSVLFEHLFLFPNIESHNCLATIASSSFHAPLVKKLTYNNTNLPFVAEAYDSYEGWYAAVRRDPLTNGLDVMSETKVMTLTESQARFLYLEYVHCQNLQSALYLGSREIDYLTSSLRQLRNLKEVMLDVMPVSNDALHKHEIRTGIYRETDEDSEGRRVLCLLAALERSDMSNLCKLYISRLDCDSDAMDMFLRAVKAKEVRQLPQLKELRVKLFIQHGTWIDQNRTAFPFLVTLTRNIEKLNVAFCADVVDYLLDEDDVDISKFTSVYPWNIAWPFVSHLQIECLQITQGELHEFLGARALTLQHLIIKSSKPLDICHLSIYDIWIDTFRFIRSALDLQTIKLGSLFGDDDDSHECTDTREVGKIKDPPYATWTVQCLEDFICRRTDVDPFEHVLSKDQLSEQAVSESQFYEHPMIGLLRS